MSDLIMQMAGAIQRDIDGLRDVATNVSNANTPGYRANRSFNALLTPTVQGAGINGIYQQSFIDTRGGALQQTGRPTDLALDGDAWFVLQTPDGPLLTRDGRFHIDDAGYLIASSGHRVIGEDGALQVAGGVLDIAADGTVQVDDQVVGRLALARVDDAQSLATTGAGAFRTTAPILPATSYRLHQGTLERSNATLGDDMVRMMEVTRHVESMQRALSAYDSLLDSGINQLGKD
jgi:flagellar basal body rod protein FlgG